MKRIIFLLLMILLVGCSNEEVNRLSTPKNVRLEEYNLKWDEVKDAINYQVMINDVEYIVTETFLDVRLIEDGEYTVKVKAMNPNFKESLYSILFNFTFSENIRIPTNVRIEDDILKWNKETDALEYVIIINSDRFNTSDNVYNLKDLSLNNFYEISIIAKYRNSDSAKSKPIIFHTFKEIYLETDVINYDKGTGFDLTIEVEDDITIHKLVTTEEEIKDFTYDTGTLVIKNTALNEIDYGLNQFIAYTNKGLIDIKIDLFDNRTPYILSNQTVEYIEGKDLIFEFELFSSEIGEVSGNGIKESDYIISDNKIIIRHQYLTNKFNEEDKNNLVLGYYITTYDNITKNDKVVIGYLFINKG